MNVLENFPYIRKYFDFERVDVMEKGKRIGVGVKLKVSPRKVYEIIPKKVNDKMSYEISTNRKELEIVGGRDLGRFLRNLHTLNQK